MSKDNNSNLRLMGSPVNLTYRGKKKDEKKNNRSRPRSALQNTGFNSEPHEHCKRPFSADNKERPSARSFLNSFNAELLQTYNGTPNNIKIVPPTTDLLGDTKNLNENPKNNNKDLSSNISDYGSEDTFISLGTKIKARAQSPKYKNTKNLIKYRNPTKRGKKAMDNLEADNRTKPNAYSMEVKITERDQTPSRAFMEKNIYAERSNSPYMYAGQYASFFISLDGTTRAIENSLAGRVSFGNGGLKNEIDSAIDTYSRRIPTSKQQLSLVEEESTQELESPSQNVSSLSAENSLEDSKDGDETGRKTFVVDPKPVEYPKLTQNYISETRTYNSFYEDFQTNKEGSRKNKISSPMMHADTASKDSGYTDSGTNDETGYREFSNSRKPSILKNVNLRDTHSLTEEPKSLQCAPLTNANVETLTKTFSKTNDDPEPLNHSRLLYKDFFLKKEGHIATAPQNSPGRSDAQSFNEVIEAPHVEETNDNGNINLEYPSYLLNSNTKAYTSKVIEDYKKEIAAINNLHELTLKDIKTDVISPTPLDIDKLFDFHPSFSEDKHEFHEIPVKTEVIPAKVDKKDISNVSTKELIENYLKVKEGDYSKSFEKADIKNYNANGESSSSSKPSWKNPSKTPSNKPSTSTTVNKNPKNIFTLKTPLSARIESVQNDKDIESWMSLSAPSPRMPEVDLRSDAVIEPANPPRQNMNEIEEKSDNVNEPTTSKRVEQIAAKTEELKPKELKSDATVLDIYSMLKEIEHLGESPAKVEDRATNETVAPKEEERCPTPKDNFMEIFQFLEKVEQSANDALSVVTTTTPQTIPKLEVLLRLPVTELAQRLVTSSLQLEERSCCIALLQESLATHKEQMINKISNLEKQSARNVARVKSECEEAVKRHQAFIDQLINDKKTLNHRIEQLVDERRSIEERWRRSAQNLEERYKLEMKKQHDKIHAAQQVARQRWVRQKAEKIKELTVKGLEGELREMADRQQQEIADLKLSHSEYIGRLSAQHKHEVEQQRRSMEQEMQEALAKERQLSSNRLEKQILELEMSYVEQRTRLVAEMRADNERAREKLCEREREMKAQMEKWKEEQERKLEEKRVQMEMDIARQKKELENQTQEHRRDLEAQLEEHKRAFEAEQQLLLKKKVTEIAAQHKLERDRAIEKAIESLEAEAQAGRKELQDAMRRNKEQYECELKELAETEQATLRRYQEAQHRVRQTEDRCAELEVLVGQLETRNKVLTEKNIQLEREIEEISGKCEASWKKRIEDVQSEMEDMKKTHDEQMHQLYAKVKVAVARKDSAIQALTRETAKYQEKITLLEQKLSQQRKDFLKHK